MTDRLLSDDHAPPPNPHGALLGTLQSQEPGDPELRVSTDAPPEYQRQPGDPDPAGATLADMTLDDIAHMDAVAHDADPTLVVNLGGQNAIADSGIDLEGPDRVTFGEPADFASFMATEAEAVMAQTEREIQQRTGPWNPALPTDSGSERLDSLVDVGLDDPDDDPDTVPLQALADIGERAVRQCIADALASWAEDVDQWLHKPDRESSDADTPMKVLYQTILDNLRAENIDTAVVWPLVRNVVLHAQENIFRRVFGER